MGYVLACSWSKSCNDRDNGNDGSDPAQDKTENGDESYLFNGNQQNIVSGDPVPVLYGRLRIPGQPCGFEIMGDRTSYASFGQGVHGADGDMPVGAGISTTYSSCKLSF